MTNGGENGGGDDATPTFKSELPETDETVSPPVDLPPSPEIVTPPPGFTAAVPGPIESECQIQTSAAVLNWEFAEPRGEQQVDVSIFDEFVPGNYLTSQILSPETDSLTWNGLIPGAIYYWRISTRVDDAWVASESAQFQTEDCPQFDEAQTSAQRRT